MLKPREYLSKTTSVSKAQRLRTEGAEKRKNF